MKRLLTLMAWVLLFLSIMLIIEGLDFALIEELGDDVRIGILIGFAIGAASLCFLEDLEKRALNTGMPQRARLFRYLFMINAVALAVAAVLLVVSGG